MLRLLQNIIRATTLISLLGLASVLAAGSAHAQGIRKNLPPDQRPENIITSFHRPTVDSSVAPWRSVGRVNIAGRAHCSGTLVSKDIVLTAAHCLYSKVQQRMVSPGVVHFVAGYAHGDFEGHSKVASYVVGDGFQGGVGAVPENLPHDWALLTLEAPLGETLGFLSIPQKWTARDSKLDESTLPAIDGRKRLELTPRITTAGYPGDRAHILSLEKDCTITGTAVQGRVLFTSCIAIQGDSGGPILQEDENGVWSIVGIQTAAQDIANRRSGIGLSALAYQHKLVDLLSQAAHSDTDTNPVPAPNQPEQSGQPEQ